MLNRTHGSKANLERVAFSPGEFAALFGKSQTWGYRQIYGGKVKAITEHGRILIPAAEVEAILKTAGVYDGLKPKAVSAKHEVQALVPPYQHAWRSFLAARRKPTRATNLVPRSSAAKKWPSAPSGRESAMARLSQRKN